MFLYYVATSVGFLAIFLILATIALILAKPGRKWVWILYGIGAGVTAIAIIGTISGGGTDSGLILTEIVLFILAAAIYGFFISRKLG